MNFRSELIAARPSQNSTNNIPPLFQKTITMTLASEVCTVKLFSLQSPFSTLHLFGPLKDALRRRCFSDDDDDLLKLSVRQEL
jgi:hypothetical protein